MDGYSMKKTDTNHEIDYEKMKQLNINDINVEYWLASREVSEDYTNYFGIRTIYEDGDLSIGNICLVNDNSRTDEFIRSKAFRPVFLLKSNIKITGGSGTEVEPYTLSV